MTTPQQNNTEEPIHIKIERLHGWDRMRYWWQVDTERKFIKSSGTMTLRAAKRRSRRAAHKYRNKYKPDELIFEEYI